MTESYAHDSDVARHIEALQHLLAAGGGEVKIAVSGGVDSLTLALLAGRTPGCKATMYHAISPAVPSAAGPRVREIAQREGWTLRLVDSGEFNDEEYLSNPYRRCFHCKKNLYATLSAIDGGSGGVILSGANSDDMQDFRPGLKAAEQFAVRHPFVECGIDKATIRRICHQLGYPDIAALPASPCLASRMETGLRIDPGLLGLIDEVESLLRDGLQADTVRCRVRHDGMRIQLDSRCLESLSSEEIEQWRQHIGDLAGPLHGVSEVHFEPYRMGSAFVEFN
jgi:uncharacterized protein